MYAIASLSATAGSSAALDGILAEIPRDPAAIFVYLLLAVSIALIVKGGRNKRDEGDDGRPE